MAHGTTLVRHYPYAYRDYSHAYRHYPYAYRHYPYDYRNYPYAYRNYPYAYCAQRGVGTTCCDSRATKGSCIQLCVRVCVVALDGMPPRQPTRTPRAHRQGPSMLSPRALRTKPHGAARNYIYMAAVGPPPLGRRRRHRKGAPDSVLFSPPPPIPHRHHVNAAGRLRTSICSP